VPIPPTLAVSRKLDTCFGPQTLLNCSASVASIDERSRRMCRKCDRGRKVWLSAVAMKRRCAQCEPRWGVPMKMMAGVVEKRYDQDWPGREEITMAFFFFFAVRLLRKRIICGQRVKGGIY
jgi:hypothetical protein